VRDGAAALTWWLLQRGGAVVFSDEGDASAIAMVDLWKCVTSSRFPGMSRVHENLLVREELSMVCADLSRGREDEVVLRLQWLTRTGAGSWLWFLLVFPAFVWWCRWFAA